MFAGRRMLPTHSHVEIMMDLLQTARRTVPLFASLVSVLGATSLALPQTNPSETVLSQKILPNGPVQSTKQFGFGSSLDIDGDKIIVGSASVHVFELRGSAWVETFNMNGFDFSPIASIPGEDVAVHGNTIAFSDLGYESSGIIPRLWVFEKTAQGWVEQQVIKDGYGFSKTGKSIDLEGNLLVSGAPLMNGRGEVRVYEHDGSKWSDAQLLQSAHTGAFGASVAVCNGEVLASRPVTPSESAHMFEKGANSWSECMSFGPDGAPSSALDSMRLPYFGRAVAFDENVAAISAYTDSAGMTVGESVIYTFNRDASGTWAGPAKIKEVADPGYGFQIAVNDNRLLVSSPSTDGQGRVWVYLFDGSEWQLHTVLRPSSPDLGILFGTSLAISDDRAVISAPFESPPALYLYDLPTAPVVSDPEPNPGEVSISCFGDGGDAQGCGECPCGNNAAPGSRAGCLNSQATSCSLRFPRFSSLADGHLEIEVTGAHPNSFAVMVSADNRLPVVGACAVGSGVRSPVFNGLRCVGGALARHGARQTDSNGSVASPWIDVAPRDLSLGRTRHFQILYRDGANPCGSSLNTSNAASATFAAANGSGR